MLGNIVVACSLIYRTVNAAVLCRPYCAHVRRKQVFESLHTLNVCSSDATCRSGCLLPAVVTRGISIWCYGVLLSDVLRTSYL